MTCIEPFLENITPLEWLEARITVLSAGISATSAIVILGNKTWIQSVGQRHIEFPGKRT